MIIGITGYLRAGKTGLADYISERYKCFRNGFGDEVRREAVKRGICINRSNLQNLGTELRRDDGGFWVDKVLSRRNGEELAIVEGIRYVKDIECLMKKDYFQLLAVVADFDLRYERAHELALRDKRILTRAAFEEHDKLDRGVIPGGQESEKCVQRARKIGKVIENNGKIYYFKQNIERVLGEILC